MSRSPDRPIPSASPASSLLEFDLARLQPLPRSFFNRDPRVVGRELLGKVIVRRRGHTLMAGRIVEDEAYLGVDDPAAHSASGPTARNLVIFGPPGHAYIYFIYGNHYCLNVSCLPQGHAGCILVRALQPLAGLPAMARNRGLELSREDSKQQGSSRQLRLLTTGPGRLCEALDITRPRDNGVDMTSPNSGLWVAGDGFLPAKIAATPRVGITKAKAHPLRYCIVGNQYVSGKII
jgi:DNA-3-methyladenine glycosylase